VSKSKNPYGLAADAYGATALSTDPRALEGTILLKAADKLDGIARRLKAGEDVPREEITAALEFNRKLWTIFSTDVAEPGHPMPQEIKNNIATLGLFIFKHTAQIQIDTQPEKFTSLININRTIASGLLKQAQSAQQPAEAQTQKPADPAGAKTDSLA
jgi:flagellar protein FlaF